MLFKDIIGHKDVINKLIQTVADNRVSHAQLILGPEGSGKLALAIAYSRYLNCVDKQNYGENHSSGLIGDACGKCHSCLKFNKLAHPDLHFVYPNATTKKITAKNYSENFIVEWREFLIENNYYVNLNEWFEKLGIENKQGSINVRDCNEINRILSFKTYESEYKIMIIWMVEKLYHAAAPKILKILEEPPEKTLFLLVSENHDQILPTIISRTQLIKLSKIKDREIFENLCEKFRIDEKTAHLIASHADGNYAEALQLLNNTDEEKFNTDFLIIWLRSCFKGSANDSDTKAGPLEGITSLVAVIAKIGREKQKSFLNYALKIARYSILINFNQNDLVKLSVEEAAFIKNFYTYINAKNIETVSDELNKAIFHIERNANPSILFMDLSLKMHKLLRQN
ncbi:MAG: DNA polymerase III subunit delta [Bacteroidetes bacterium]|nr:DNA polymerase III subunit delta [Bacteroidota bacterium]